MILASQAWQPLLSDSENRVMLRPIGDRDQPLLAQAMARAECVAAGRDSPALAKSQTQGSVSVPQRTQVPPARMTAALLQLPAVNRAYMTYSVSFASDFDILTSLIKKPWSNLIVLHRESP